MAVKDELAQMIADHQGMVERATQMQGRLGELEALPSAIASFAEPMAQIMEAIADLNEQVATLANIVSAPRKYVYREDGMPVASVPDLGDGV